MSGIRFRVLLCLPLAAIAIACGNGPETMARVNGSPVSKDEFYAYLENMPEVTVRTENGKFSLPVDGSLGYQALKNVLNEEAVLQLAKDKGLYPTDEEVQREVEMKLREDPGFLLDLEAAGLTLDVIRKNLRFELAQNKLITQGVTISDQETKRYIAAHRQEFMEPERIRLTYVLVATKADLAKVNAELGSGASFNDVALRYSQSPTAHSYNAQYTDPSQDPPSIDTLPPEIRQAVAHLKLSDRTGWIQFGNGYAMFYVDKLIPAQPIPIDGDKLESVRRALAKTKGAEVHDINQMTKDKLRQSRVEILADQYKRMWQEDPDNGS